MILQQLINGLMLGATYSLVAIGYTLIFGVLGLLHFAHGEVLMAGSFIGLYIIQWTGWPLVVTLPLTMLATGALGILIDFLAIRPIRKDFHLAPLLSTIGVTMILQNLAVKLFGGYGTRFPKAIEPVQYHLGPVTISSVNLLILSVALSMMIVLYFFIAKTRLGRAMRAVSENPVTAAYLGVNVELIVLFTFGIASALAGAAGVMIGITFHAITPFIGAMVGGLILGLAEVFSLALLPTDMQLQNIFSFGIMALILIFKPSGLFGSRYARE